MINKRGQAPQEAANRILRCAHLLSVIVDYCEAHGLDVLVSDMPPAVVCHSLGTYAQLREAFGVPAFSPGVRMIKRVAVDGLVFIDLQYPEVVDESVTAAEKLAGFRTHTRRSAGQMTLSDADGLSVTVAADMTTDHGSVVQDTFGRGGGWLSGGLRRMRRGDDRDQ